ncbi:MAG TPA: FAD-dependent oxidoreductase, partial [Chitinophagaceae bacterium]|nr:FAD-dependent oxidoreductase [Chitinophagaceae bacterium]
VIGLCCAYYLNKQGYKVTVIDRNDITDGCSFGNMGYISPSHFIPLASPGIIRQGLKWMLSSSSPFYIQPRLNWDLIRWGLTFRKNANEKKVEENIPHLNDLLQLSRKLMNDLKNEFHDSFDMIEKGCWALYKNERTGDHERHLAEEAAKLGLKTEICSAQQVQSYEREVEVNVAGGVLWLDDCHLRPAKFMEALHSYLEENGVEFLLKTEVKSFERKNGSINAVVTDKEDINADQVVIANGSWMPAVARMAGIHLLMQPGKGYSVVYENMEKNLQRPAILVEDRTAMTPIDRWLRIGGTMELSGHSDNILPRRVNAIYTAVKKYFPSLNISEPQPEKTWYGYRPVTPDGLPYIGRHSKYSNLLFAGGHAMLGLSAAAGTGKVIEEIVDNKKTSIDLSAFSVERFS